MPKFRKIPVVIEACQWFGDWDTNKEVNPVCACQEVALSWHVHTVHDNQAVALTPGDWIIPEPDGIHFYPCKPDIFKVTYEPVED